MDNPEKKLANTQIQPPPQDDQPDEPKKVLKLIRKYPELLETIQKLATNRWYVNEDANLLDLADDLNNQPAIRAVGVVNSAGTVMGIIIRQDLFELLGRPFGRDVLLKESVARVAQPVNPFLQDSSIFSVSDEIGKSGLQAETRHFPLRTAKGEFSGIFSTQDLLVYLSELTQSDMALARSLQSKLVRESILIENTDFEFVSSSTLSTGIGGDFYHVVKYEPNKWAFILGDVSSRGVAANLTTSTLWGFMQSYDFRGGIKNLIVRLNRFFISTFSLDRFLTAFFLDFDPANGSLLICDQGHGFGYIVRSGKLLKMKTGEKSMSIGVSQDIKPEVFRYQLQPKDQVILMSDGLLNQNNQNGEKFGLNRVKKIFELHGTASLKDIKRQLLGEYNGFRKNSPQQDDATFLILRYK